jgi:hypothetical protein
MSATPYEFEIAISFLKGDEILALQIRDSLAPIPVFVYSKEQEQIVGTDGVETFRDVFRNRARVSLVLFREDWGKTPWTRVEESAIRDRCLEVGWEYLVLVQLQKSKVPKWVPDSYIFLDFVTFGLSDLIGVLKGKLLKSGVELKQKTPADRAYEIAQQEKFAKETHRLLVSGDNEFRKASAALFKHLEDRLDQVRGRTGWSIDCGSRDDDTFVASTGEASIELASENLYPNNAAGAYLTFMTFEGRVPTPKQRGTFLMFDEPRRTSTRKLEISRLPEIGWCWKRGESVEKPEAIADFIVDSFLSAIELAKERKAKGRRMR